MRTVVSGKVMKELIGQPGVQRDGEISAAVEAEAYRLPDGRIVYRGLSGKAFVWPSVQALREHLFGDGSVPTHVLNGVFVAGDSFVGQVPLLVARLADMIGLPSKKLDFSVGSLKFLDKKVLAKNNRATFRRTGGFEPLLAYIGEVFRHQAGGQWEVRLAADGRTREPWLVNTSRGDVALYKPLLKELTEVRHLSLYASMMCELFEKR
jgi:hypothetical protein